MVQLVRLMVLGAVVLGATVLMALPRRGKTPVGETVASNSREPTTDARSGAPPAPGASSDPGAAPQKPAPQPPAKVTTTGPLLPGGKPAGVGVHPTPPQPPKPVTTPVQASRPRSHTIASGDTLQKISKRYYGSFSKWRRIADANPGVDPTRLRPGQKLVIP